MVGRGMVFLSRRWHRGFLSLRISSRWAGFLSLRLSLRLDCLCFFCRLLLRRAHLFSMADHAHGDNSPHKQHHDHDCGG